jgi:hypothetical protein
MVTEADWQVWTAKDPQPFIEVFWNALGQFA